VRTVLQLLLALGRLVRTDLGRAGNRPHPFAVVFVLGGSVGRLTVGAKADVEHILVVGNSGFLQVVCQVIEALLVALSQSVSPELLHFSVCELLSFFHLLRIKLYLSRDHRASSSGDNDVVLLLVWVHVTVVVSVDI